MSCTFKLKSILAPFLCIVYVATIKANDVDPCAQYRLRTVVSSRQSMMTYSLAGYNVSVSEEPYVDSIWITDTDTTNRICTMYIQARETIDISFLNDEVQYIGRFLLNAQVGSCRYANMFVYRNFFTTDVILPAIDNQSMPHKVFLNGQLQIRCHDKTYSVHGVEMK